MYTCKCGVPVQSFAARDGKLKFRCQLSKCKLFACSFVRPEGYPRPPLPRPDPTGATKAQEDHSVFFEACLLPRISSVCSTSGATLPPEEGEVAPGCSGLGLLVRTRSRSATLHTVLLDPSLGGEQLPQEDPGGIIIFRFPVTSKSLLLTALYNVAAPQIKVYDLPVFFCKCFESLEGHYQQRLVMQHAETITCSAHGEVLAARKAMSEDTSGIFAQLKPYQRRGVEFIVEHGGRGMIADEMGLGKTVQAIAAAHLYRDEWPLLIMCPVSLMENWAREVMHWLGIARSRMVCLNSAKQRADLSVHSVVIVAYSSLRCVEHDPQYRVVVMDESHLIKSPDARRSVAAMDIGSKASRVILLSGTPSMSRPAELYTQLSTIHPKEMPTKSQFDARYSNAYFDDYGYQNSGHSHLAELYVLLRHFAIRRKKKDVLAELPAKTRSIVYVTITAKEKKLMEGSMKDLRSSIAKAASSAVDASLTLGSAARGPNAFELKLATAKAKIPAVKDYVADLLDGTIIPSEEKVILFAHHKEMIAALIDAVRSVRPKAPLDYIVITGETAVADRESLADHFRTEPKCHVAILSMQACGTGHNFTCASMVIFTELDWNPSTHLQCEDRVHRIGQESACTIRYLLAEDTSDAIVWPLLQEKMTVTSAMLDNVGRDEKEFGGAVAQQQRRTDVPAEKKQGTLDGFFQKQNAIHQKPSVDVPRTVAPSRDGNEVERSSPNSTSHARSPVGMQRGSSSPLQTPPSPSSPASSHALLGTAPLSLSQPSQQGHPKRTMLKFSRPQPTSQVLGAPSTGQMKRPREDHDEVIVIS